MSKRLTTIDLIVLAALLAAPLVSAQSSSDLPKNPSDVGYLNLHKRHPDGNEGPREFDRLTTTEALFRLEQVRGFLASFRHLTDEIRAQTDPTELRAIGNTGRETQTIGFHNIPLTVEGMLLKQAYQLAQSRYELAVLKNERKQVTDEDVVRARFAYQAATAAMQTFWDTKLPTD